MNITTKPVEYKDGDQTCVGYLAWDESYADPKPCVVVSHAWGGLDDFAQEKAIMMAALGYVGFAIDNYGDGARPETVEEKITSLLDRRFFVSSQPDERLGNRLILIIEGTPFS